MAKYASLSEVPAPLREKLQRYFSDIDGSTFVISGLPAELTGGLLARYSRAPTGIKLTLLNEFLDDAGEPSQQKGSALMDRVLNAYGDDSVGELEGIHVGIEDVSQLLTKTIEDRRIGGSPIEQSTRYVKYDSRDEAGRWRYLRPQEVAGCGLLPEYEATLDKVFETYSESIPLLERLFRERVLPDAFTIDVTRDGASRKASEKDCASDAERKAWKTAYNFTVRCAALDVARCILPASTLTQLGLFGNGRFFTHLISTLKTTSLKEAQDRGEALSRELDKHIPTFIKRNRVYEEEQQRNKRMASLLPELSLPTVVKTSSDVVLQGSRASYMAHVLASCLYSYTALPYCTLLSWAEDCDGPTKEIILKAYLGERKNRRDRSGRGFEAGYPFVFDITCTFGEYRDLERHRMLTQQRQLLSPSLGFILPDEMEEIGFGDRIREIAKATEALHYKIEKRTGPVIAQYAVLFNHRMRAFFGMNLREVQHLTELRSQPNGHFGYRRIAMEMAQAVLKQYPELDETLRFVDYSDPDNKIARATEQSRIASKNIKAGISSEIDL